LLKHETAGGSGMAGKIFQGSTINQTSAGNFARKDMPAPKDERTLIIIILAPQA